MSDQPYQQPQDPNQPPSYQPQPGQPYPPVGPPQPPPPAKKSRARGCLIAGLVIVVVIIIGAVSCTAIVGGAAKKITDDSKTAHTVLYNVTGTGTASVTYSNDGNGGTAQDTAAKLPWSKTVSIAGLIRTYTIIAQNGIEATGVIGCKITVDGKVVKESTSTGQGAIAECTYTES